ncbi:energy transducer TonB [Halioxenophilus sp. WMMB6]|uniref:energy transducer TonB n=1 Tax=Halioxenophilus sp. WMMB6 TaxID=3073815 RepID=UPI00295F0F4D|nr:energy transducer TonB [Halioxenophilus sp. WMMB6]
MSSSAGINTGLQFNHRGQRWRLLLSTLLGLLVAFFLTWFMSALIESGDQHLDESGRVQSLDFVRVKRNETVQAKTRNLIRPNSAPPPDAPDAPAEESSASANALAVTALPTGVDPGLDINPTGIGFGAHDGEYLPIVKVAAVYPLVAQQRRIEGACLVTYTVTTTGSVKNVSVVPGQCDHPVFEKVSLDAALKFKYKPRVVNGEAIEVQGVYNRFIFELQTD